MSGQLAVLKRYIPQPAKRLVKTILLRNGLWSHPGLLKNGVLSDLYYWAADSSVDTLLPLQNFFSVFYPDLDTTASGAVYLRDPQGRVLGMRPFQVPSHGLVKLRVSQILKELGVSVPEQYGSLWCDYRIPPSVLETLSPDEPFYFWDRFYLGYLSANQQPCFVHGVDKTFISNTNGDGLLAATAFRPFHPSGKRYTWVPEIPVNIQLYKRFSVILVNRTVRPATVVLTVADREDRSRQWTTKIRPFGVHRFELDEERTGGLHPEEMRLRVDGLPSPFGRPVVFKEFRNGAISAMHC